MLPLFDPSSNSFFIYNIPFCGGFCAPTVNTDEACWRHFSNEFTVPASAKFMKLAPCCEHSIMCRSCGMIGHRRADHNRKKVMGFGTFMNAIALVLCILGAVGGLASDRGTLRALTWVHGEGYVLGDDGVRIGTISIQISTKVRTARVEIEGIDNVRKQKLISSGFEELSQGVFDRTISWGKDEDSCKLVNEWREACESCQSNTPATSTLILSIITQFPTMATNLQRSTRFGDVNCQKTMGVITNVFSLLSSLSSMLLYRRACYTDMPEKAMGTEIEWRLGIGFRCIMITTLIKIVDATCHAVLPTPRQRWRPPEEKIRDVADYMLLAPPVAEDMESQMQQEATASFGDSEDQDRDPTSTVVGKTEDVEGAPAKNTQF
eukprot:TRINITY_DN42766_c0_g1_i1.p1 TRINITY_DN42766_c0_g1~~TRINITY_DN42766_c0_g1_i1.p1  ORF type:complete len:378 (+),score=51.63 TRINITY_DN42766_c0_g1_i1:34-1167(+)